MPAFEWNNTLKVVVGEITRKQQMQIWNEVAERGLEDLPPIQQSEAIADILAVAATRSIYIRKGKSWEACNGHCAFEADEQAYTFDLPMTEAALESLPMRLASQWVSTALEANGGLETVLNFSSLSLTATTNGSETAPEPEPSTGPDTTA